MTNLRELHESATPAPWEADGDSHGIGISPPYMYTTISDSAEEREELGQDPARMQADAALIVALRNAYADGSLVEAAELTQVKRERDWLAQRLAESAWAGTTHALPDGWTLTFPEGLGVIEKKRLRAAVWLQAAHDATEAKGDE